MSLGAVGAAVAGGIASGVVGKALGGGGSSSVPTGGSQTQIDPRANFKPITLTTGVGSTKLTGGDDGLNVDAQLDPRLQALQSLGFDSAGGLFDKYLSGLNAFQPRELGMSWNPEAVTQGYFDQQMGLLNPQFEQQRTKAAQDLFGSGRMGLNIAGSAVGAGENTGMVNPDAYGLSLAQSRATNEAYSQARAKALAELQAQQQFLRGQDVSERGLFTDYLSGGQSMFDTGTAVNDQLMDLIKTAMNLESARSGTYTGNTSTLTTGQQETLGSQMAGALAPKIGGAVGDWAGGMFNNIGGTSFGNAIGYQGSIAPNSGLSFDSAGWVNGMGG